MATDEIGGGVPPEQLTGLSEVPLESLGDLRRAMAKVCNEMRTGKIERSLGNALMFGYSQLAGLLQDHRDSKFKRQINTLWKEREAAKAAAGGH